MCFFEIINELFTIGNRVEKDNSSPMERAKPLKFLLVLAVMVAGGICMWLPEKKIVPVASVKDGMTLQNDDVCDTLLQDYTNN